MKLKTLWKKSNRGVILACILLIVLAGYIVVDKMTFNNEKPMIDETMQQYLNDYFETLSVSSDFIAAGGTWDNASIEAKKEEMSSVIDTYWTDTFFTNKSSWYTQMSKADFLSRFQSIYTPALLKQGYISDVDHMISQVKITKNGPGAAMYTCTLKVSMTSQGSVDFVGINGERMNTYTRWMEENTVPQPLSHKDVVTYEYELQVELMRENGAWKLSNFYQTGFSTYTASLYSTKEVA